jgi:Tfp pilus assembly protein PilF
MIKISKHFFLLLLFTGVLASNAQKISKKETADLHGKQALLFIDQGKTTEAMDLLQKAQKLDPVNISYPYEIAVVYYSTKEFDKAIQILEKLRSHKDVNSKVYQLLGNCYDDAKKTDKAIDAYIAGLRLFPKAPEIYLELGNIYNKNKDYSTAIKYYEKGIDADPRFPSNYYWAAKLFCASTEKVWGILYGETFMTIERNSSRTAEISKLLYNTYLNQIRFYSDSSVNVNFTKNNEKGKPSFEKNIYESIIRSSVGNERSVTIASLGRIRTRFIEYYFRNDLYKKYPNVLFDFEYKAYLSGHNIAFTYWLLSKGDDDEFVKWVKENPEAWQKFLGWLLQYSIPFDEKYKLLRSQYQ